MAAQFGRWNFDGAPLPTASLDRVGELLAPWGPEGRFRYRDHGVELQWLPFETTEKCPGKQPMVLDNGEVLLWDGRLDNGREILNALGISQPSPSSDVEIVAAAWSEWGEKCLAKLVGDWALSFWVPSSRCLFLAADILATRHLFYSMEKDCVQWSSVAHPLILMSERRFTLDEEYLAGWVGSLPAPHLTPFRELHRVPPASVVTIRPSSVSIRRYWDFGGDLRIRYASDREYEEHFLQVFRQSVRRRLRSNSPILAELSGGMDSSAIVCIADQLTAESQRIKIDTVSYYDDSEPHWNERPWFTRIEAHRGQGGLHIDVNAGAPEPKVDGMGFRFQPGAGAVDNPTLEFMINRGHRALLSGIGGDEFLGGIPTPLPELEDLLAHGKFGSLARQLTVWAMIQRRPWIDLLRNTAAAFLTSAIRHRSGWRQPPPWLTPGFARRQRLPLSGYSGRLKLSGPPPSFQENLEALGTIRRQLACADPSCDYPIEKRYPYLDRDLLEYLFAVPREQLVRPGERRSLMRRSLAGIVPGEVLNRRRKAFVSRAPLRMIRRQFDALSSDGNRLRLAELGIVDPGAFRDAIRAVLQEREAAVLPLMRALTLEQWLRALDRGGVLDSRQSVAPQLVRRDETRRGPVSDPSAL